jgi:multiple sugar transport system substrate-binding protein
MMREATRLTRRSILEAIPLLGGTVLAACRQAGAPGTTGEQQAALKPGTVLYWHWGGIQVATNNYHPSFVSYSEKFMQKFPNVKVEVDSPAGYWDKIPASIAAGNPPDVFFMNSVNNRPYFNQGAIKDLTPLATKDRTWARDQQQMLKSFVDWYTLRGKLHGVPFDYSTIANAYNLAHLREVGLTPPSQLGDRWDWNMLADYATRLTRREGGEVVRWGFLALNSIEVGWYNFVTANGGAMWDQDGRRCTLASPQAIEATQFLVDLIYKSQVSPNREQANQAGNNVTGLINNKYSMTTNGDWNFKPLSQAQGLEWDVTFIPKSPRTGKTGSMANLRGLVMTEQSKVVEQAWAWMTFLGSKEIQDQVAVDFAEVPARTDSALEVYTNPDRAGPPPGRRNLRESILATLPIPAHEIIPWTQFTPLFTGPLNDIWDGKVGVAEGLRMAQENIQKASDEAFSRK